MAGSDLLARLFIDPSQSEILADTRLFLHVASYFLPVLGLLCILRYTIQGAGYTNLAMLSGVSEMIARTAVSVGRTGRATSPSASAIPRRGSPARPLPRPRLRLRLRTAQTHDAARKTDRRSIIARSSRRAFAAPRGWRSKRSPRAAPPLALPICTIRKFLLSCG